MKKTCAMLMLFAAGSSFSAVNGKELLAMYKDSPSRPLAETYVAGVIEGFMVTRGAYAIKGQAHINNLCLPNEWAGQTLVDQAFIDIAARPGDEALPASGLVIRSLFRNYPCR